MAGTGCSTGGPDERLSPMTRAAGATANPLEQQLTQSLTTSILRARVTSIRDGRDETIVCEVEAHAH